MSLAANLLAVALMILAPFVRPCGCEGFTLFCACTGKVAAPEPKPEPRGCCCHGSADAGDQDSEDSPCPDDNAPCKKPVAPELRAGIEMSAPPVLLDAPHWPALPLPMLDTRVPAPLPALKPESRPPPTSLLVAQTCILML
ncbi:MAG: hypothetical protein IT463_06170 [Planctomycetes bacterium]|nr:hypothetical protein [Planctomycetota bacterium]